MMRRRLGPLLAATSLMLVAGCVAPRTATPAPTPAVATVPMPALPSPPPPPPPTTPWIDAPLSPGNWNWRGEAAEFGPAGAPSFVVRCDGGRIHLQRRGAGGGSMMLRASNAARPVSARAEGGWTVATLEANDPLIDALLFSRGRFSVEAAGTERLIVPSWPEPARVVDECRRRR